MSIDGWMKTESPELQRMDSRSVQVHLFFLKRCDPTNTCKLRIIVLNNNTLEVGVQVFPYGSQILSVLLTCENSGSNSY
jgi:hypothetical protein